MRLICAREGNTIVCRPGDEVDLSKVCSECQAEALELGVKPLAAEPARTLRTARATPPAKATCTCGGHSKPKLGPNKRPGMTAEEVRALAEEALAEKAARTAPRPYTGALTRMRGETKRASTKRTIPRPYTTALKRRAS